MWQYSADLVDESIKALPLLILFDRVKLMKNGKEIISDERRTGDLQNMSNLLAPLTRKMLGKRAFAEADVVANWNDIVGDETAAFSKPIKIDFAKGKRTDGVLVMEVAGGAFALEMQLREKIILEKVNTFFGYGAVAKMRIVQNPKLIVQVKDNMQRDEKMLVTKEEENYIRNMSEGLNNSGLEQALHRLGIAVVVNNKK